MPGPQQVRGCGELDIRKNLDRDDRIVFRDQDSGWRGDLAQLVLAAALLVIVTCSDKPVQRSRESIIEITQRMGERFQLCVGAIGIHCRSNFKILS